MILRTHLRHIFPESIVIDSHEGKVALPCYAHDMALELSCETRTLDTDRDAIVYHVGIGQNELITDMKPTAGACFSL